MVKKKELKQRAICVYPPTTRGNITTPSDTPLTTDDLEEAVHALYTIAIEYTPPRAPSYQEKISLNSPKY